MGKRYYCDYCDKLFADNPENRKKHIRGVVHERLRKLHYAQFREPEDVLASEKAKLPCKKLQQTGFCPFEGNCRFSHLTAEMEETLRNKIKAKQEAEKAARELAASQPEPTVEEWLSKRAKRRSKGGMTAVAGEGGSTNDNTAIFSNFQFTLPEELQHVPDLPPSLIPPTADCFADTAEWGV
ncbi:zinc finger matrin-type protein 5-like [Diadema setosum]|uniref:zinc finger matrin-type protein 5-like n=1 Tax=Diadema setosum TaxID=31175 RepID=UPI003B3AA19F